MVCLNLKEKFKVSATKTVSDFLSQACNLSKRRLALSKLGSTLVSVNKKFTRHNVYRQNCAMKFKSKWKKAVVSLTTLGAKYNINSLISLEEKENELPS